VGNSILTSITNEEKIYIFNKILNRIDKKIGLSGKREALLVSAVFEESLKEFLKIKTRRRKKKRSKKEKKPDNRFEKILD